MSDEHPFTAEDAERLWPHSIRRQAAHEIIELRADLARARARIEELEAENRRLRELYANQAGLAKRGWTIDHLMECEEALRMAEGAREAAEARIEEVGRAYTHDCSNGHEIRVVGLQAFPCPWCAVKRAEAAEARCASIRAELDKAGTANWEAFQRARQLARGFPAPAQADTGETSG